MKKILSFILVAVILALCLGACSDGGEEQTTTGATTTRQYATIPTTIPASSFSEAFSMRDLTSTAYDFESADSSAFVGLVTEDTLELYELGYDGDTVKEAVKTFYMHLEGYDETQKLSIKQSMEENFAAAQALSCVTLTHEIVGDYYVMRAVMNGLDNSENLSAVCREGLLDFVSGVPATLSVKAAEDALTSKDFIKR